MCGFACGWILHSDFQAHLLFENMLEQVGGRVALKMSNGHIHVVHPFLNQVGQQWT